MFAQKNDSRATGAVLDLKTANLSQIGKTMRVPAYDRAALACGIVHMSVGGFHRSHEALYIDDLLAKTPGDWMISAIGLLEHDKAAIDTLNAQDGLYAILERKAEGDTALVAGAIKEAVYAPGNAGAVFKRLLDPRVKILSLTITEKGYCYDNTGNLDTKNAGIQNDLSHPDSPKTGLGYIVSALARRRREGLKPFTVMSCDNLPGNGHLTKKLALQFAREVNADLAKWIEDSVSFPNAMVDRITPRTTPEIVALLEQNFGLRDGWPVVCEDFRQWVLEDDFRDGRPALETVGVQMVKDVEPYEKMKVRLLNGSHSALSYLSYLAGHRRVDLAMADPLIRKFVRRYMDEGVTPAVPPVPGIDLKAYKDKLIERFSNPAIGDQVQRLAEDGSQKIPNAILPCIRHQLQSDGPVDMLALALAGWFRYLTGVDEKTQKIDINDPLSEKLMARVKLDPRDCSHVLSLDEIFGTDLRQSARLVMEINKALEMLHVEGSVKTLETYLRA